MAIPDANMRKWPRVYIETPVKRRVTSGWPSQKRGICPIRYRLRYTVRPKPERRKESRPDIQFDDNVALTCGAFLNEAESSNPLP